MAEPRISGPSDRPNAPLGAFTSEIADLKQQVADLERSPCCLVSCSGGEADMTEEIVLNRTCCIDSAKLALLDELVAALRPFGEAFQIAEVPTVLGPVLTFENFIRADAVLRRVHELGIGADAVAVQRQEDG